MNMTVMEIINRLDALKPNTCEQAEKVKWLSQVEWMIKKEIVDTHEGGEKINFDGYDPSTSLTAQVIAPPPFDKLYLYWLEAQMDYANGEYQRYNNSMKMFNTCYNDFAKWYNRNYMPKSAGGWKNW